MQKYEVPVEKLRWQCDPGQFKFDCTKDVSPLREFIGQDRARRAIEFGLNVNDGGYNIYVAGLTGTGKTSMVKTYIERLIKDREDRDAVPALEDWCYLYNFKDADVPQIVSLPKGKGHIFRNQMSELLGRVKEEINKSFSSEEYKGHIKKLAEEGQVRQRRILEEIAEDARQQGFLLQITPMGPALIPMTDGRPMEEAEYMKLKEPARREMEAKRAVLTERLQSAFEKVGTLQKEASDQLQKANRDIAEYVISRLFVPLANEYRDSPKITQYLADLRGYTLDNFASFRATEEQIHPVFGVPMSQVIGNRDPSLPFQVNLFVDNSENTRQAVVIEPNPNFGNMFGKIERKFLFGGYLSDHTMLKAGALSRANGGYLLLSAYDVLVNPGVWVALKRALKNGEVRTEDPYEQFGLIAPQGLRPEPMPIKVKVMLIGDAELYQMLSTYDEDFWEIFRVKAQFSHEIERTEQNIMDYAAFIAGCCEECQARHFEPSGVAKVLEFSSRLVGDQDKLSSRFSQIKELVTEANYWAGREGARLVNGAHVKKAIDERLFRHNLVDERMRDMISRGVIMIDTEGEVVGQVNGLSVYSMGDIEFGKPSRITAKTFLGRGGVINIERESQLSGPIHNKGVMILSGYLGWKYAQDKPLSLSASLCFEQSYSGVEGDSASSTELYAILSSLSGVPIRQNLAVTGSVNQRGEIQPIGGVNHKIEGFFQVCQAKGLNGSQGVMIPYSNMKNLMLRDEVIDAIQQGKFHIYAVKTIDEGIEVLTGKPAGERQADGTYPPDAINFLVDKNLRDMAERLRGFMEEKKEKEAHAG